MPGARRVNDGDVHMRQVLCHLLSRQIQEFDILQTPLRRCLSRRRNGLLIQFNADDAPRVFRMKRPNIPTPQ